MKFDQTSLFQRNLARPLKNIEFHKSVQIFFDIINSSEKYISSVLQIKANLFNSGNLDLISLWYRHPFLH